MARKHRRRKFLNSPKRHVAPGVDPGSVIIAPDASAPQVTVIAYGPHEYAEYRVRDIDELNEFRGRFAVCWVNIDGLGNADTLRRLAEMYHVHPLAMEDIVNRHQRAKVEQYGNETFLVTHMLECTDHLESEQLSIYFGRDFVLTFQEEAGWDCLQPLRARLKNEGSRLRTAGAGYLAYSILDAVIDHYFPVLERFGDRLEDLEDRIIQQPQASLTAQIHGIKRELLYLRRTIWPQREALNSMIRDPIPFVDEETKLYLRDCYDHAIRIIDLVETYREVCSDLMDLYLSSISNRMNEIMKVLTVISTLFIPLTFIAGVYGMNFHTERSRWNMPELDWHYGYPLCLLLMLTISVSQLIFFRRKGWIGPQQSAPNDSANGAGR